MNAIAQADAERAFMALANCERMLPVAEALKQLTAPAGSTPPRPAPNWAKR